MCKTKQSDPTQWFPMPIVLITSQPKQGPANIMALGYIGFCSWDPPIISVGIHPSRYTNTIIHETMEYVVNVPGPEHILQTDYCGFVSGISADKISLSGFSTIPGTQVKAPLIKECFLNLECKVKQIIPLGSHEIFIGEVVATHVDQRCTEGQAEISPLVLLSRKYMTVDKQVSYFGESGGNPPQQGAL